MDGPRFTLVASPGTVAENRLCGVSTTVTATGDRALVPTCPFAAAGRGSAAASDNAATDETQMGPMTAPDKWTDSSRHQPSPRNDPAGLAVSGWVVGFEMILGAYSTAWMAAMAPVSLLG